MFLNFAGCAFSVLVVPRGLVIKLKLRNHIFTFWTLSLKLPAGGTLYYARRLPNSKPS